MIRLKRKFNAADVDAYNEALLEAKTAGGELPDPPFPTHVEVKEHRGELQNFSDRLVDNAVFEGWATLGRGKLTLHTADGDPDVEFNVLEVPGVYCCHCDERLQGGNEI